jgi:hypothetical protein
MDVCLVQSGHHHLLNEMKFVLAMIKLKQIVHFVLDKNNSLEVLF